MTNSNQLKLVIISPIWEIIGNSIINLTGYNAGEYKTPAATGGYPNMFGSKGLPGKSGGSGGIFFGLSENIVNSKQLEVIVNGGNGGPGQQGGQGGQGKKGIDATCEVEWSTMSLKYKLVCNEEHTIDDDISFFSNKENIGDYYYICGKIGRNGSIGGIGGVGGHAGLPGQIKILNLATTNTQVIQKTQTGLNGEEGKGGIGGLPGETGDYCTGTYKSYSRLNYDKNVDTKCNIPVKPVVECKVLETFPGGEGKPGKNNRNQEEQNVALKIENPWKEINNYKAYLRETIRNNGIQKNDLIKFYNQLNESKANKLNYSTLGLVDELESLENHYLKLKDNVNFLPFYQDLLGRILEYVQQHKELVNKLDEKKVLVYLYTATLTKICSINNDFDKNIVIDIKVYLETIEKKIKTFEKFSTVKIIEDHQKNYKDDVNDKITEATNFVKKEIKPAVTTALDSIDTQIVNLINETVDKREELERQKKKLEKQEEELKRNFLIKSIIGVLKLSLNMLSFLGPLGEAGKTGVGAGLDLIQDLSIDTPDDMTTIPNIPDGVKDALDHVGEKFKEAKEKYNDELEEVKKLLEKQDKPEKQLPELNKDINDIQDKIKNTENENELNGLRKQLKDTLDNKKKSLEKARDLFNENEIQPKLDMINNVKNAVTVINSGIDLYKKIMDDKNKIDTASKAIKQAEKSIEALKKYEKKIHDVMIPLTEKVGKDIAAVEDGLKNKTHVALDVTKWRVQSSLRDVKIQLGKLTKDFEVQDDLAHCIQKLEEGMTVMITLFDRIESYKEQAKLAAYIADINSAASNQISVKDPDLSRALNKLNIAIQVNVILMKYENAMHGLKQYLFPFADLYMNEISLPNELALNDENDLKEFIAIAINRVSKMLEKISEANASLDRKHDTYLQRGKFSRFNDPTSSFYVWKKENNANAIANLLAGNAVYMKADITENQKNAVKFNILSLYLNTHDDKLQRNLDNLLKSFEVRLTHFGNSYYRCDDKVYLIKTNNQTVIEYSFASNSVGLPNTRNFVYDKLSTSDYILSPYAMWKFELLTEKKKKFYELRTYSNLIDLELEGYGQYIRPNAEICGTNLEKYYEVDFAISETDDINNKMTGGDSNLRFNFNYSPIPINYNVTIDEENEVNDNVIAKNDAENVIVDDELTRKVRDINSDAITSSKSVVFDWISNIFSNVIGWFSYNNNTSYELPALQNIYSTKDSAHLDSFSYNSTNLDSTLLLADLVVRKFTGIKPTTFKNSTKAENLNSLSISLNIITDFEKEIEKITHKQNIPQENLEISYSELIGKVQKEINKNNFNEIYNILYKILKKYQLTKFSSKVDYKLKKIIEKNLNNYDNNRSTISKNINLNLEYQNKLNFENETKLLRKMNEENLKLIL